MRWMGLCPTNASILGTAFDDATRRAPWNRLRVPPVWEPLIYSRPQHFAFRTDNNIIGTY